MNEALLRSGAIVTADELQEMPYAAREKIRGDLVCPSCRADAYFIREARNGRRACFGARPHGEDCELASVGTDDGGGAALDETDERINAGDVFQLEPNRSSNIRHVHHDPTLEPGTGSAVRYTRRGSSIARISSLSMDRLLRQLALREGFRRSNTMLILPDDTRGRVKTLCTHMTDAVTRDVGRRRIYWGTIRFPRLRPDGAWLNTGRRISPSISIGQADLNALLQAKGLEDVDDLSGSYFAFLGPLRSGPTGKLLLFVNDLEWFAVRPHSEDSEVN